MVRSIGALALVVLCLGLGGCGGPKAYNVDLALGSTLLDANGKVARAIEVDVIAVNSETDLENWKSKDLGEYFRPNDQFRAGGKAWTAQFSMGSTTSHAVLSKSDPKWNEWLKGSADKLVVVSSAPGRKVLPLDRKCWPDDTIEVRVEAADLRPLNGPTK